MRTLSGMLVAAAVILSACGGGTSVSDSTASESSDSESSASESSGSGSAASFCDLAAEREAAEDNFDDNVNIFIPGEVENAFSDNRDLLQRAVEVAPAAVKEDLELIQQEFEVVYQAFEDADWDATKLGEEPPENPEADAAGDRVDQYVQSECGIDPEANEDNEPTDEDIAEMLDESDSGDSLIRDALMAFGFGEDQAQCLADTISATEFEALSSGQIPADILDRFDACGVGPEQLAEIGGNVPAPLQEDLQEQVGDIPPGALQLFADELVKQGFTPDEATCIAGAMFQDSESVGDIIGAFGDCDIPLSRMAELGGS